MKLYNRDKDQISAYFDGFIPEAEITSEPTTNQNTKTEILLKTSPHITEEDLKNHIAVRVLKLYR